MTDKSVLITVNRPSQLEQAMRDVLARRKPSYAVRDEAARRWRMPVTDDDLHESLIKRGGE